MTIAFAVNGSTFAAGIQANWQRPVKRKNNDGTVEYQDCAIHTWEAATMDMTEYEVLRAAQGQVLTSLVTTTTDDPNTENEYTGAEITSVARAQQVGRRVTGVRVEYRVKV